MLTRTSRKNGKTEALSLFSARAGVAGTLSLAGLLLMAACSTGELKPVDIFPEDMCSRCRMAISEQRSAGEIILRDGTALKFDDIGCMAGHDKGIESRSAVAAHFVADFGGGGWVDANQAFFVRSPKIRTPMSSGTVAFRDRAAADAAAAKYEGTILRFDEVFER